MTKPQGYEGPEIEIVLKDTKATNLSEIIDNLISSSIGSNKKVGMYLKNEQEDGDLSSTLIKRLESCGSTIPLLTFLLRDRENNLGRCDNHDCIRKLVVQEPYAISSLVILSNNTYKKSTLLGLSGSSKTFPMTTTSASGVMSVLGSYIFELISEQMVPPRSAVLATILAK